MTENVMKTSYQSFALDELKFVGSDEMTFEGYGSVFSNVDFGGDLIEPGAFKATLAAYKSAGRMPAMFYGHGERGGGPMMPVGVWTDMYEDSHGLKVAGKLSATTVGKDLHVLLRDKAIGGLSIGYKAVEFISRVRPEDPRRRIKTAFLGEVSLVNDPMNPLARVTAVKSADELKAEIKKLSDLKNLLREVGGYSHSEAEAVCSNFQAKACQGEPDADEAFNAAIARFLTSLKN